MPLRPTTAEHIIRHLKALSDPKAVAGMARFGIVSKKNYGISMPRLRALAKEIGHDHSLAARLWASGILDARILASLVDDPRRVTSRQMDRWARDFDNWAICDQCCLNLFRHTPHAYARARAWTRRRPEFVKRAGFALLAGLAVRDKAAGNGMFLSFLPILVRESGDGRHYVKTAVNWALRQTGKRNRTLNRAAIAAAKTILAEGSPPARWIAADALRELTGAAVRARLRGDR